MARLKSYLVPVDFSKASEIALRRAAALAREDKAQLLLVHVITDSAVKVPFHLRRQFYDELEKEAGAERKDFSAGPSSGRPTTDSSLSGGRVRPRSSPGKPKHPALP